MKNKENFKFWSEDKEADAAYIYFKEIGNGEVAETITLNDSVNIDLDKNGKVLGSRYLMQASTFQLLHLSHLW